jgi:copper chaperone CopZ
VLAVAVPLYVCATGSVPIAMVLMMKGLSPGAALVFLMAGPATNAATITVLGKSLGKKTLFAYLASITIGALAFGLMIDYLFPANFFTGAMNHNHNHEHQMLPEWFGLSATIILAALIIHGYFRKYFYKPTQTQEKNTDMEKIKINVTGMNCNHCQTNVEKNVGKIEGIKTINADYTRNLVEISGDNIDMKKVEETVKSLGYEYKGVIDNG